MLSSLAVLVCGCGDGRLTTHPAAGRVVFTDGSPVHVGTVELKSRDHGVQARGAIDTEGHFVLTTYEEGDGAVAGRHDCVVVQMVVLEGMEELQHGTEGVVAPRYGSYATSGLEVEVRAEDSNALEIVLEPFSSRGESSDESPHGHEASDHPAKDDDHDP